MSRSEQLYVEVESPSYDIKEFSSTDLIELADRNKVGPHTPKGERKGSIEKIIKCNSKKRSNATVKRRNRRNKLKSLKTEITVTIDNTNNQVLVVNNNLEVGNEKDTEINISKAQIIMADNKSRDDVIAARQAKKLAKKIKTEKDKPTEAMAEKDKPTEAMAEKDKPTEIKTEKVKPKEVKTEKEVVKRIETKDIKNVKENTLKSNDEVDKAVSVDEKNNTDVKAQRAAKKAAKQAKKKGAGEAVEAVDTVKEDNKQKPLQNKIEGSTKKVNEDMTVKDVVQTLKEIVIVAKDIKDVTEKVSAIDLSNKKSVPENKGKAEKIKESKIEEIDNSKKDDSGKSKAELKAERRAKQEAQRAAKQALLEQKVTPKAKEEVKSTPDRDTPSKDIKVSKTKTLEKSKTKSLSSHRVNWFQHLYKGVDNESLKSIAINSHLHPAIIKLGVQLASRVVTGSNARCIALLDALKKMVRDYTLPAKTEFARGLESHLVPSLVYLWANRPPSSSQENAVKFFRYHLTQLPNNVDEFDAKKTLQEEIDRYIREQIDMAGEAISIAVRNKISNGDNILTYGCSSLIERILREAWSAGVHFRTVVVGNRVHGAATQMLRRLVAHGLPCTYIDITALSCVMNTVNKVVLGAGALLGNGSVLGAVGSAQVALAARDRNVPVLVACETHKFSERVQTDAFVYNEIGDPDDIIDKSDNNSPLKDWRSNQNLTPLNLTYDVTPACLVTAVVTELAILPCTSAPVVLRFKLSEYGV